MRPQFALTSFVVAGLLAGAGTLEAASPSLSIIQPRGVQRGTETVLTFSGARLADAQEIFFYSPGFEVTKIEPEGDNACKATVKVSPDCRLGEHVAQVRTATGISDYRTFYVGALPEVAEAEPNTDFETPQKIDLNVTVTGVVQSEDVDYFVVEAKQGQRICAEAEGMRLGNTMFDPYVAILDSKRFELSAADDTPLVLQDSIASVVAPEDGQYIIEMRESAYGGNGNCFYRLHVGTFPQPTAVYPAGGKRGEEVEVRFLGDPAGEIVRKIAVPAEDNPEFVVFASDDNGIAPTENPFRPFDHGNVLEVEPNNGVAEATPAELPLALNGIIETDGDTDFFRFAAKKGQTWEVECYARRIRSGLDPVMVIHRADGNGIASNDDSRGPDSYIRFQVPEDGEYLISIRDHLGRGAPDFVYRVELSPVTPSLTLGIPRVARYSQYRQTIYVPRGNRFASLISASRANFGGDLVLEGQGLPEGITMHCEPMPSNQNVMPVVFEAAEDAPLSGKLVDFRARHADENQKISGGFTNRADFVIAAPGQSLYSWRDVDRLAVAVVDKLPFRLEIVEPKVPLVRDGSMQLKIVAHREEGFTKQINVQFPYRPPGVGAASSVNIPEGQNEVLYPLNANGNAQIKKWKVYAIGQADVGGAGWVASQLATLEVAEPYVSIAMERAACEQGQQADVFCKVTHNREFAAAAKVQILGLPAKVTAPELELAPGSEQLTFPVQTAADSPAGNHKNIFCQVVITENGEPIVHRVGGTEIRIDKPLPMPEAKKEEPKPEAKQEVAKQEPPKEKPLSRLEKLRLEAKQRAAGGSE